jgi:hypothetical protein
MNNHYQSLSKLVEALRRCTQMQFSPVSAEISQFIFQMPTLVQWPNYAVQTRRSLAVPTPHIQWQ